MMIVIKYLYHCWRLRLSVAVIVLNKLRQGPIHLECRIFLHRYHDCELRSGSFQLERVFVGIFFIVVVILFVLIHNGSSLHATITVLLRGQERQLHVVLGCLILF